MKKICAFLFLGTCLFCSGAGAISDEEAFRIAEQFFDQCVAKNLLPTNVPFAQVYREPFRPLKGGIDVRDTVYGKNRIWVTGQVAIKAYAGANQMSLFANTRLSQYIQTNETQCVPSLSTEQAHEQALRYLDILGVSLDKRAVLSKLSFGDKEWEREFMWIVNWEPSDGGYRYDDFLENIYSPCIGVSFSEKYGLVYFGNDPFPPPPKTTEVRISREAAIFKAEKAVPLVMLTPYYRQCRMPGFKVSGVKSAELRIACPNWLLDPARAIWLWDSPPKETRLCWIVRFTTVDTVEREKGIKLLPPDILIYVDAATGEIVGANFT